MMLQVPPTRPEVRLRSSSFPRMCVHAGNDFSIGLYALKLLAFRKSIEDVESYAIQVNHQNNPVGAWHLEQNDSEDGLKIIVRFRDAFHQVSPEVALRALLKDVIHVSSSESAGRPPPRARYTFETRHTHTRRATAPP